MDEPVESTMSKAEWKNTTLEDAQYSPQRSNNQRYKSDRRKKDQI